MMTEESTPDAPDLPRARLLLTSLMAGLHVEREDERKATAKAYVQTILDNGWQASRVSSLTDDERRVWGIVGYLGHSVDDDPFELHQEISRHIDQQ